MKHVPSLAGTPVGLAVGGGDGERLGGAAADVAPESVVDYVAEVQGAVPLVPGSENDCCARLVRRLGLPRRDTARTWLTFLRGVDLAVETDEGFRRTRTEPSVDGLRTATLDGVVGAREIAERVAAGETTAADAFDAVAPLVPRWERTRTDDWESVWRGRVARLCDWLTALGLATVAAPDGPTYAATLALTTALEP